MNDLSSLDWNTSAAPPKTQQNLPTRSNFSTLAPSPGISRAATPLSAQGSGNNAQKTTQPIANGSKSSASDSFSNLLASQPSKPAAFTSLQDRQKQLQADLLQANQHRGLSSADDAKFLDGLGSRGGSGSGTPASQVPAADDLLAAFSSSHPVDASSHFPVPKPAVNGGSSRASKSTGSGGQSINVARGQSNGPAVVAEEDDDPFGLGSGLSQPVKQGPKATTDEDDILGDLGKPVSEAVRPQASRPSLAGAIASQRKHAGAAGPRDKAIAELVEMGFGVEQARNALAETEAGVDVQAAVGVILSAAHQKSSKQAQSQSQPRRSPSGSSARPADRARRRSSGNMNNSGPAWMRQRGEEGHESSKANGATDKELIIQHASEIGTSFMKSANTFWKASQKRVAKAVAEFQPEGDPNQPKWMRDGTAPEEGAGSQRRQSLQGQGPVSPADDSRTREAALLDASRPTSRPTRTRKQSDPASQPHRAPPSQSQPRAPPRQPESSRRRRTSQEAQMAPQYARTGRVNRQMVEDEIAQAYVSPARRKKQTPVPAPAPPAEPSMDIFSSDQPTHVSRPSSMAPNTSAAPRAAQSRPQQPTIAPRPKQAPRQAPPVSPSALSTAHARRQEGTAAFKRGDFDQAHSHYSAAIAQLPPTHPVTIVIRCNRAITALKNGNPRGAIEDADAALNTIGPSTGEGETIALGGEGEKPMREFYGKALMRKAEAHEHMEKWMEAAKAWRQTIEAGLGGAIAIQGRDRCEKALRPAQTGGNAAPVKKAIPPRPKPPVARSALADMNGAPDGAAVQKLREKAAAEAAASDEAFSLTDVVDAKLSLWKGTKSDNLRALLASLDTVLWPDAIWKKIGMGDIVLPNKVKIVYMRAIAKVHPDKLPRDATTEQKMISASVFATLNEAWDKFKQDNNM